MHSLVLQKSKQLNQTEAFRKISHAMTNPFTYQTKECSGQSRSYIGIPLFTGAFFCYTVMNMIQKDIADIIFKNQLDQISIISVFVQQ